MECLTKGKQVPYNSQSFILSSLLNPNGKIEDFRVSVEFYGFD